MIDHIISYSFDNHKPIDIIYMKGMEITKRRIRVFKIEHKLIKAIDIDKGEIRSFKIDSILSAMHTSPLMQKDINTGVHRQEAGNNIQWLTLRNFLEGISSYYYKDYKPKGVLVC